MAEASPSKSYDKEYSKNCALVEKHRPGNSETPGGAGRIAGLASSSVFQSCVLLSVNPVSALLAVIVFTQTQTHRVIYRLGLGEAIKAYGR